MKTMVLIFSLFLIDARVLAQANKNAAMYVKVQTCTVDATDPYDPSYRVEFGKYKGMCLDATTVRPPVIKTLDHGIIEIANFYHNGRYWIARIPQSAVTSVMFQGVPFGSALFGFIKFAHGQLRFKFSQPIELQAQSGDTNLRDSVNDIIISSTATKPKGISYSLLRGSSFGITTRVLSTVARAVEEISSDKSDIHQYELDLTVENMNRLLGFSIEEAAIIGYFDRYGLLTNNCSTKVLDVVDTAFERPKNVKAFRGSWWQLRDVVETPALEQLKLRNINYTQVNDLNSEVICALPGETLGQIIVDKSLLGAASAICKFKSEL